MEDKDQGLAEFVQLMTNNQNAIRAFIVSLMPGDSAVADVLQETNIILWRKRAKFELGTNFIAWAFTIARFEVMRQRGKRKRDHLVQFSDELLEKLSTDAADDDADSDNYLHELEQ